MKKSTKMALLLVVGFGALMWGMSWRTPMWMDEYVFYKLALNFPDYSMDDKIFFVDRPAMLAPNIDWESKGLDRDGMFSLVYDTPIYPHTPLMPMVFSPLVKGLNWLADKEIIPHIEEQPGYVANAADHPEEFADMRAEFITNILRAFAIAVSCLTLWVIYKIMEFKVGAKNAILFALPIAASSAMLYGAYLFYWDVFMMLFFSLTLYFLETHSKWRYFTACLLVNTKMFLGIAFLFPLFAHEFYTEIKTGWKWPFPGWKIILPVLSIIPFYLWTLAVTNNPLYLYQHYIAQVPLHDFIYTLNTPFQYLIILLNLGMQLYIPMTAPIIMLVRKYPAYMIFWAMSMFYAWATGLGITHTSTMVYSGALVFPLVVAEYNLAAKFAVVADKVNGVLHRMKLA